MATTPHEPGGKYPLAVDRRATIVVLAGTFVAVVFAAVATSGEVELAERAPRFATESAGINAPVVTIPPVTSVPADSTARTPFELPQWIEAVVRALFWGCVAVFAVLVLVYAWRHRPRLRWRLRRRAPVDFETLDDVAAAITADADAQRAVLQRGSPRNAIVECWLRLETAVVDAGVRRDPADTSTDLMLRVLAVRHVEPEAIAALAALYREARFSDHAMGEDARRSAIDALDAVHDGLRTEMRADDVRVDAGTTP
jgi:hypothetical protein